ncbi:MAG: hypothetical protein J6X44_04735, partial [Thermoguttaceae bacterium]|nr:hypothetical protein [Thermoguttaceae bacterium]
MKDLTMKRTASVGVVFLTFFTCLSAFAANDRALELGNRRELFVDDYLVSKMENVELLTHRPERKNLAMIFDKPWEGDSQNYFAALFDGSKYRLYYHAWGQKNAHPLTIACIESDDGVNWTHPELGLHEFGGNSANSIVINEVKPGLSAHDFSPFLDLKPGVPEDEKFKAIGFAWDDSDRSRNGLYAWKSSDSIHWTLMQEEPVYT